MLTLRPISVVCGDDGHSGGDARRVSRYLLDKGSAPQTYEASDGDHQAANSLWLGSPDTLTKLGLQRGVEVTSKHLEAALEGRHAVTNERVRGGRWIEGRGLVVGSTEAAWSVPKKVSVVWSQARGAQRDEIKQAVLTASNTALEYLMRTREVVRRRAGEDRISEVAQGWAASATLHVVARTAEGEEVPSPQLHVHTVIVGVEGADGKVRSADRYPLFTNGVPLEGGAVFRAVLAHELVKLGYEIRSGTGPKSRFFEIVGVPQGLSDRMSARSRELCARREKIEAGRERPMTGREAAGLALATRRHKLDVDPDLVIRVWRAQAAEFGFGPEQVAALLGRSGYRSDVETRRWEARQAIEELMRERGPTVTATGARTIAYEVAAGRMSLEDAHEFIAELRRDGTLLALADGDRETRVTTRSIRELEKRVMAVAEAAAARRDAPLSPQARAVGLAVANAALGNGNRLADEQRKAFAMLTSGTGWAVLTGRAGTGKNPTLHAVAAAYEAEGWQVIACATDGTTATRLGYELAGGSAADGQPAIQACSITQLLVRVEMGLLTVDERTHPTLILIDEATKVGTEQWWEIARLVQSSGARLAAVGHTGQHDAIRWPGLFAWMVDERSGIPVKELATIRRHLHPTEPGKPHPWLGDYQVALDEGRAEDAIAILRRDNAITLHDTRHKAMDAMVADWNRWRRLYPIEQSVLLVHGSNADVDAVNVLAQQRRIDAGELGGPNLEAVDRTYRLYVGDPVMMRNSAYWFEPDGNGRRERRIENGQVGVIEAIDPDRDVVTVSFVGPAKNDRGSAEIDLGRLRREHAEELFRVAAGGKPAQSLPPSLRLVYACHTFPEQGATELGSSELGHPGQGKEGTYVAGSRSKYRHSVHVAREDLLRIEELDTPEIIKDISDEEFFRRYAEKIKRSQSQQSSISYLLEPGARIAGALPTFAPTPRFPSRERQAARHSTSPGDPIEHHLHLLGDRRAERLDELARTKQRRIAGRDDQWLVAARDRTAVALERLDPAGALEVGRLQRDQRTLMREARDASQEADRLKGRAASQEADRLKRRASRLGIRRWGSPRELLQEAAVQDEIAQRAWASRAELVQAEQKVRGEGRHPDDWMRKYEHSAALCIAADRELAVRQELAVKSPQIAERVEPAIDAEAATRARAAERANAAERADAMADARAL